MLCTQISVPWEISTTQSEVENLLLNLNANKATGVDGIPARILKSCARELSILLTKLLEKAANVKPDNAKENVENCKSISLLSILGKCQERIIHGTIYTHVSLIVNKLTHSQM